MALITNPADVIKHIIHKEVQHDSDEIAVDDSDGADNNDDIVLAFTVHDKQINSKKLIEEIASNSRLIPYIKDNTLILKGIMAAPSPELTTVELDDGTFGDVDMYIESSDIISYTNKRTAPEKVYSKVIVNYHYDYALKDFTENTLENSEGYDTATEYFDIIDQGGETGGYDIANLGLKAEQDLSFDAHYIRDIVSAEALQEFLLLWHCNQHNVLKLKLPLKYIQLKIGDYIGFDKLINGVKLFGEDYSIEHFTGNNVFRNGQQILPVWMVTSTNKTLTHIDVEMIQMHNCSDAVIDANNIAPELTSFNIELIHPTNQDEVFGHNIALSDISGQMQFDIKFSAEAYDVNNDAIVIWVQIYRDPLDDANWSIGAKESIGGDHAYDNDWNGFMLTYGGWISPTYWNIQEEIPIDGTMSINLGEINGGTWLTDFLEDSQSEDYLEIPAGFYKCRVLEDTGGDFELQSINVPSLPIRIFKDRFPVDIPGTVTVSYNAGWNLVSLPLEVEDAYYPSIFPDAVPGSLYGFDGTYGQTTEMQPGNGYWLNFEESGSVTIDGVYQVQHEIELRQDWNLIGGIGENSIDFWNNIIDPDGIIVANSLFGFDLAYFQTDDLVPGKAYWIRTSAAGTITINLNF